ncbi:MAG TPA: diacylglycerol kinase family protein [Gaiellales bacterium]|jgi:diacylglycerol kinase family enzyme|nr:diacylglycerol kinase family protein [Gaiellales bacterium]
MAALSLLAAASAALVVVVAALSNGRELVVALLGVVVLVGGGWTAVSRRGAARTTALVVAAGGLALLLASIGIADVAWWRAFGAAALGVLSVAAARSALHTGIDQLQAAPTPGRPVPAAANPVLLMNPKSGGGKAVQFDLVGECAARGIQAVVLGPGDDLLELAEDAITAGADVIGMAGGDGSQALIATVASRHGIPHVVVPAGTRNHFALDLGLDRDDVVGALDAFADAVERTIDLATVNGRVFVNNASLGLYAKIVQAPEYRDAKMRTAAAMLPDLLGPDAQPLDLRYAGPDGSAYETAHMVLVSNNAYQLADFSGRGTRERIDRGLLGVVTARIDGTRAAEQFVALNAAGQIRRFSGWLEWTTPRFRIDSGGPVEIGIDGEAMTLDPPLVFESLPAALRVRLPGHAPGVSPAARRISRSTLGELWGVIAGRNP